MIVDDLIALAAGKSPRRLLRADTNYAEKQAGIGDAASVEAMASERKS